MRPLRYGAATLAAFGIFLGGWFARAAAEVPTSSRPELAELAPVPPYLFGSESQVGALFIEAKRNDDIRQWTEALARHEAEMVALATVTRSEIPGPGGEGPASSTPGPGSSDSCYGVIPDAIVNRESGGNPHIVNPSSGAYGCFQIIPSTWAASCSDLARDVAGQRECASRLPSSAWNY